MTRTGRPAGPAAGTTEVVLSAALGLVLTEGGPALTAQRLHQVTGVSRSTIYRHWPTPTTVLSALIDVAPEAPRSLSGDPTVDAHRAVDDLCDRLRDKPVPAFLQALVAMAHSDPEAAALRQRYVDDLAEPIRRALVDDDIDPAFAADAVPAIVAPLLIDAAVLDSPVDRDRAHRAIDLLLGLPR